MTKPRETLWDADPHTIAKHRILRGYLEAWFPILASVHGRIVYYDGFAGPGRYRGGEEGSPLIALSVARDHRADLDSELAFVFVEERRDRADFLRSELERAHIPDNFVYEVKNEEFAPALGTTLDALDERGLTIAPTFAFIDPFGIKGLPFQLIARLLARRRCEVLITFMTHAIQRFVTELPEHVDALVGVQDAAARIASASNRVLEARRIYEASLLSVASYVRFFELRGTRDQPIYDLFFASNHPLGHYKMKEAMWRLDASGEYRFSDGVDPSQERLFEPDPSPALARDLLRKFGGATVDATHVIRFVRDKTPYLEKHCREALKRLERGNVVYGRIRVAEQKAGGKRRLKDTYPAGTIITFIRAGGGDE